MGGEGDADFCDRKPYEASKDNGVPVVPNPGMG